MRGTDLSVIATSKRYTRAARFRRNTMRRSVTRRSASKRMNTITELRSRKDLSDAVSLLTVDEITAEVENSQHGSDEEYEEEEEEEEEEDEDEEYDSEDCDEVELELHDADEPGKPITSHAGLLSIQAHPSIFEY